MFEAKERHIMWRYEFFADQSGQRRWRLRAGNGRKVATSGESFSSRANAERAAKNVKMNAGTAILPARASSDSALWDGLVQVARRRDMPKTPRARA
jgi:uncharacterized protein YegP (UPF0339 family)